MRSPMPTGPAESAASSASTSRVVGARRGVEHVLVRPQPERARHHVGVQEPRPQHLGADQVAVVAARADRRDVAQPARLREVGRRRHAPLRVQVARAEAGVDALLPRGGAARRAQAAHAEEALDQPVVLEDLHAPRHGLVEQPLVELGVLRMRAVAVDPHRELVDVRRLRRQVAAVRDERPAAEPLAQRRRCRRAARRRAAPSAPCRSAARPTRRCRTGAAPRAGTTTSRAAPRRPARRALRGRRPRRRPSTRRRGRARCGTSRRCRCRSSTRAACRARRRRAPGAAHARRRRAAAAPTARSSRARRRPR